VIILKIGVLSVQGAISEHVDAVANAAVSLGLANVNVIKIRKSKDLEVVNALIIPGGESTTISKLMVKFTLFDIIINRAREEGLPILGTCAGCIVLASEGDDEVKKTETELLKLMDMRIDRNAFGRQRESFESDINIDLPGFEEPFHAVFIRAPVIEKVWGKCKILSKLEGKIIFAQQGNLLAAAFHPELTNDMRIHEYFLGLI
jgi:5'-phosphate synthase pdxT subunit